MAAGIIKGGGFGRPLPEQCARRAAWSYTALIAETALASFEDLLRSGAGDTPDGQRVADSLASIVQDAIDAMDAIDAISADDAPCLPGKGGDA